MFSEQILDFQFFIGIFAVVSHRAKNLLNAMDIASEGLRHSQDNHTSPRKNYTIVNLRKQGE